MSPSQPVIASADTGSFTRPVPLENTYTSDTSLQRALSWYLPASTLRSIEPHLSKLGAEAISPRIREWSADAERNQPYVKSYNVWGAKYEVDKLVTTEGWKQLGKWGAKNGVVSLGYDPAYGVDRRTVQYAVNYLYSPSSGLYSCPISMSDGAAFILSKRLKDLPADHLLHDVFKRLTSNGEDYWTSGQWMTERAGGSDVQNTETWARYSPLPQSAKTSNRIGEGDYLLSGFKFFSSATDADVALLLAKTESGKLSTFIAPLRKTIIGEDGKPREVTNGVRIHRLKNKLGTKELPTAELELKDMRAHLVGELDQGIPNIAPLLNITRVQTFLGSLSGWRRAISIAKSFAKARTTVGEPLWLIPMHLRLLADLEVKHRGAMDLAFFTIAVMGLVENDNATPQHAHLPKDRTEANVVFRVLTATAKAVISKTSISGIQECQEALGGVGYMDEADEPEFNISRILRNTLVNSIWEGTTNILASELVRFLLKRDHLHIFKGWLERTISLIRTPTLSSALKKAWSSLLSRLQKNASPHLLLADSRRVMFTLSWILSGTLLALDAKRDGDGVTMEIARRWILLGEGGVGEFVYRDIVNASEDSSSSEDHVRWDCRIAWGVELPNRQVTGHRSLRADSKL
ncbi:acyl-CoA dehydrogenase [Aspergillus sclerotialis]|uniref:Acyl-CoA dehydrogenase n=1 Tax=Aspergillus sclerotialis TaxID=2070753 RepID=A0A3A2ZP53_9EURO|nr:acyl-CoA dehydrogenase [Aspergillus sclerotialis]